MGFASGCSRSLSRSGSFCRKRPQAKNSSRSFSAHFTPRKAAAEDDDAFGAHPWKGKQLTSIGKLVNRQTAGEVRSTAEAVNLQQLNVERQNWHMRSWRGGGTVPVSAAPEGKKNEKINAPKKTVRTQLVGQLKRTANSEYGQIGSKFPAVCRRAVPNPRLCQQSPMVGSVPE